MLAAGYGWEPQALKQLDAIEVTYYLKHLPLIEARRNFSMAQLNADLREFIFPRYVTPEEPSEPPKPRTPWTVEELLPPWAYFDQPNPMTPVEARVLVEHFDRLPAWAQAVAPITEARTLVN